MATVGQIVQQFQQQVFRELQAHNSRLHRKMTTERLSGRGPASLGRQTGALARSLRGETSGSGTNLMRAAMGIGGPDVPGAWVHEAGATLTPKSAKNLAIPLSAGRTAAGVPRVSGPRAWPKPLMLIVTKSGKKLLIEPILQKLQVDGGGFALHFTKRKRSRKTITVDLPGINTVKGGRMEKRVKAIYVLKPSVTVPSRLGFRQTFEAESAETIRRLQALCRNP